MSALPGPDVMKLPGCLMCAAVQQQAAAGRGQCSGAKPRSGSTRMVGPREFATLGLPGSRTQSRLLDDRQAAIREISLERRSWPLASPVGDAVQVWPWPWPFRRLQGAACRLVRGRSISVDLHPSLRQFRGVCNDPRDGVAGRMGCVFDVPPHVAMPCVRTRPDASRSCAL